MGASKSSGCLAISTLSAFVVANGPLPAAVQPVSRYGPAHGIWELPLGPNPGWVSGALYDATPAPTPGQAPAYQLSAALTPSPVACPACIAGTLQGVLDDGLPGTPNLAVVGTYSGAWGTGSGTFQAQILGPTSNAPVGWLQGKFSDPPLLPVLGQFHGRWVVR